MAYIKQLKIEHYKSFSEKQVIDFAVPSEDGNNSGLNIIVGSNNSGKSTVFDALLKLSPQKFIPRSERHTGKDVLITVVDETDKETVIQNNDGGHQILLSGEGSINDESFEIIPSRRYWSHQFSGAVKWAQYSQQVKKNNDKNTADGQFGRTLADLNRDPVKKTEFNRMMRTLVPDFRDWTTDSSEEGQSEFVSYTTASGANHNTSLLGDGIISLFRIVSVLVNDKKDILLIDEPELSLHPQALKRLAGLISRESKKTQVIICTHSPYFVDWSDVEKGAHVIRINKDKKDHSIVKTLKGGESYFSKITSLQDYQKPQLLDLVAKEIFFSDAVVFVEGQEDVGLLLKYIEDNGIEPNFDFFGYGSGGAGNISVFLELAELMGVKAGAIFDGDKGKDFDICAKRFPEFHIRKISKPDIRDKYRRDAEGRESKALGVEKEGVFSSNGSIKSECETEVANLIKDIVVFFAPV